jgi:DNA-binding transcriptional LysR family regulator
MDISSQMLLFVKVVECGSISAASRAVGQTPSAVSKQIGLLEDQVRHRPAIPNAKRGAADA